MPAIHIPHPIPSGSRCFLHADPNLKLPFAFVVDAMGVQPTLAAGTRLLSTGKDAGQPLFTVIANDNLPFSSSLHSTVGVWVTAEQDIESGSIEFSLVKQGLSVAWVTLSDKGSRGEREDRSGPLIDTLMKEHLTIGFSQGFLLPDAPDNLKQLLTNLALQQEYDVICTTGGTGVGPRDTTPEATLAVIDKRLYGFEQAMMQTSLAKTHNAVISRAVAGTLGGSLLINLPGSRKAVAENLEAVLPAIQHTVDKLQGDTADCGVV